MLLVFSTTAKTSLSNEKNRENIAQKWQCVITGDGGYTGVLISS